MLAKEKFVEAFDRLYAVMDGKSAETNDFRDVGRRRMARRSDKIEKVVRKIEGRTGHVLSADDMPWLQFLELQLEPD